ncbi:hypothetical protein H0H87_009993 [Tephrocybe sp. NHM501043]|nr:hypothetical protein H0H87_009993 [Tephrocybe sp. NHM501043]
MGTPGGNDPKEGTLGLRDHGDEDQHQVTSGFDSNEPVPESKLEPEIHDLCKLLFSTSIVDAHLTELNYDAKKLPLGKLGQSTIVDAYAVLQMIHEVIEEPKSERAKSYRGFRTACENLSSAYYTLIPHNFGRKRPTIINDETLLRKELDLLDALKDMEFVAKLTGSARHADNDGNRLNPLDANFRSMGLTSITPVAKDSREFATIQQYIQYGEQDVSVVSAFRVER